MPTKKTASGIIKVLRSSALRKNPQVVLLLVIIAILSPWLAALDSDAQGSCRVNSIYDGDTMRATCDGEKLKIRFYCIDTPEMKQSPWGKESRDFLRSITPQRVTLSRHNKDRYGRIIGEVMADGKSLNLEMVRQGYAAVYPQYCKDEAYFAAQTQAKSSQLGIWSKPGLHQQPWQWRQQKRNQSEK